MALPERSTGQTCDELASYSFFDANYPLDVNNEYHVTSNITWNMGFNNMNVHGSIVIEANKTLTIDGPTIRFADSRNVGFWTNIVVKPGGDLVIRNGAKLTTIAGCTTSMWDGIKVLGITANAETFSGQGVVTITTGSTIENAICAIATGFSADPTQAATGVVTQTGGIVVATDANFVNNVWGVVLRKYNSQLANDYTNTKFFRCVFRTSGFLNYHFLDVSPEAMLHADEVNRVKVGDCQFYNNTVFSIWGGVARGDGIRIFHSSLQVLPMCGGLWDPLCYQSTYSATSSFWGLFRAIRFGSNYPNKIAQIRNVAFWQNAAGISLSNATMAKVTRNSFSVPGGTYLELPLGSFNTTFGLGMWNCTGFEVEENTLDGSGDFTLPAVGMVYSNTGVAPNEYYNNKFYSYFNYGTIIQHVNDGPSYDDGLDLKCNDYGFVLPNKYDVAFTGEDASVGSKQGAAGPGQDAPAGNTFSGSCMDPATHMVVGNGVINPFDYWHHDPLSTPEIVLPTCISPEISSGWYQNTSIDFDKESACPSEVMYSSQRENRRMAQVDAEAQLLLLKQVYDAQRDGGDTEGLRDYIADPAHSSYDVRNQLMLAAPRVSREIWLQVFARDPAMNPWHLAQALLANSPLQSEVVRMMEESDLTPFYKQLVMGSQGTGISMLSIQESELSHFRHKAEKALNDLTAEALTSESEGAIEEMLVWEAAHPQHGVPTCRIALLLESGDVEGAKTLVDEQLNNPEPHAGLELLSLALGLQLQGLGLGDADETTLQRLNELAAVSGPGQSAAQTWLQSIGEGDFMEEIILPDEHRTFQEVQGGVYEPIEEAISAYPNPASMKEPVYVVAHLPEGMEQATVRIFDPLGRVVKDQRITQQNAIIELSSDGLLPGLYFAKLSADRTEVAFVKFEVLR